MLRERLYLLVVSSLLSVIGLMMGPAASAQIVGPYSEPFEVDLGGMIPSGADNSADWHFRNDCPANLDSGHTSPGAARWGNTGSCGSFDPGGFDSDFLDGLVVMDFCPTGDVRLAFKYFIEFEESCSYDRARLEIAKDGGGFETFASSASCGNGFSLKEDAQWHPFEKTISGVFQSLYLRFIGETDDNIANSGQGFFVDDIVVECGGGTSLSAPDVPNVGGGSSIVSAPRSEEPVAVTLDGDTPQLLVTSRDNSLVSLFASGDGAFIDLFVLPASGGLDQAQGLAFGPDGNLYVASYDTDSIFRYDGSTGAFIDVFVSPTSGGLDGPVEFVWGPDGNLYVASFVNDSVIRYNGSDGSFLDAFVTSKLGGLDGPEGLSFGPDGRLYVTSSETDAVIRYDGTSGAFVSFFVLPTSGGLDGPVSMSWGPDGNLYVSSFITDSILRYNGSTGAFIDTFVSPTSGGLNGPVGQAWGPDGHLYVASFHNHAVNRFDGETGASLGQFVTPTVGALDGPRGLLFTNTAGSTAGGTTGGETTGGGTAGGTTGSDTGGGCSLIR